MESPSPDALRVVLTAAYNDIYTGPGARDTGEELAEAIRALYGALAGASPDRDAIESAAGEIRGHISCISLDPGARFALDSAVDQIERYAEQEIPQRIGDMTPSDYAPSL